MDILTKNALWDYWKRGDDEIALTNGKVSDLDEKYSNEDGEIAKIFRIKTNILTYEMPLCKTFNEFNYLFQIDPDVLTKDIVGFKTYEEYKDGWIYEWNKDNGQLAAGKMTDIEVEETYLEHLELGDYENTAHNNVEREPNDANDIDNLDYDLVRDNTSYYTNEEEEQDDEDRCELLENPRQEPSVCEIRRFEMIKYSFGPVENYVAIKECEYDDLTKTEEDAYHGYQ
ncbi:hypothetical protein Tco_1128858 [Tanacetum coccineum]